MAITRKPVESEKEIEQLIQKGGSVAATVADKQELVRIQLRLPPVVIDEIDALLAVRLVKPSRHTWFLEAVYEKIERGKQSQAESL